MSEQSVIDDLYNLTESDVASATEYVYDRSRIAYPEGSGSGDFSGSDEDFSDPGLDLNPQESGSGREPKAYVSEGIPLEEIPDEEMDAEDRDHVSDPSDSSGTSQDDFPDDEDFIDEDTMDENNGFKDTLRETPSVLKKKKSRGRKRHSKTTFAKKSVVVNNNSNTIKKKVQVAAEETATQRVQVNAGYENPEIPCLASGCSGVLLKWVVTFYGTEN